MNEHRASIGAVVPLFHNLFFLSVLAGQRSCLALWRVPETKNRSAPMAVNVAEWGKQ